MELEVPTSPSKTRHNDRPYLLSYDETPDWYKDNEYILHGYRPESRSTRLCFKSWLYLHNESINIFSHLLPACLFLAGEGFIYKYFDDQDIHLSAVERFIIAFFLLSAAACLGLSATYHTMMNHSEQVMHIWLRFDFAGIVILTLGDFVSGIYMVFYCESTPRIIYWTMICVLGTLALIIQINPKFQGKRWRTFRVAAFVATGLSGFAPLIHGIILFGFDQMLKQSGMPYYIAEGGLLFLGAVVFTTRFPECFSPGSFDTIGSSHQIFHVLVVIATVVHLFGLCAAMEYNYHHRACGLG